MKIPVTHSGGGYDIILERGVLSHIGDYLPKSGKVLIVTDDGVPEVYAKAVADSTMAEASILTLPQGEATKSLDSFRLILSRMLELAFHRSDAVIAVGGGVIGDLSGFAASAYMRGVDFYNIPTTLLSQVDSSIGGKVAVDMDGVKNVVGAFYQPKRVIIDPNVLKTLAQKQRLAGLAEAIKMAATSDSALFEKIEKGGALDGDLDAVIEGALLIKRDVVERDTQEKSLRRVLNFGHTVGHAIESEMKGTWLHGECVALGMLPMCSSAVRARFEKLFEAYGLPTEMPCDKRALAEYMRRDKKASGDGVVAVFVSEIGSFEFRKLSIEEIEGYVEVGL